MDYEKELMQAMLSRESKTAQSLLERGGNFALIAENVTLFYRALTVGAKYGKEIWKKHNKFFLKNINVIKKFWIILLYFVLFYVIIFL